MGIIDSASRCPRDNGLIAAIAGPEETRPRCCLPAEYDSDTDRGAVGEKNQDPPREKVSDAGKIKGD